ncbi:MAG: type II secretion system F family protein [Pirellulaceae bacterium]|nr:type II secretion system F family protein [Pirellulaceae bacterium]
MPTYEFEAMDATGQEIRDVIEAQSEEEAQTTIRQMGYFVTRITVKKTKEAAGAGRGGKKKRGFAMGGGGSKVVTSFTRQLSILQDAGLPIVRSLKILEGNAKPGKLKNALQDVVEEIEAGSTLSEGMSKCPKVFNRLYVNMIKAGEAGGALEVILQRLADFMERAEALKRKVKGAMIYPAVVISVAVTILTFIMLKIVPVFTKMFEEFELELPGATLLLVAISEYVVRCWFLIPLIPVALWLFIKLCRKFKHGRMGWDMFILKLPIFGQLVEKNTMARTTRTLGTLVASGVPILEGLQITRDTSGNAVFERLYSRVADAIREGEPIAKPMKKYSTLGFHPGALFFWAFAGSLPGMFVVGLTPMMASMLFTGAYMAFGGAVLCSLVYMAKMKARVVDDLVVNMVDVGEETGELDTMLYKVADTYDDEVKTLTDSLTQLMEPIIIVFLGGAVGFIVISLFLPLVEMIKGLS